VTTLAYFMFAGGLLVATFIDLEWLIIPDEVSLPGAALGLLVAGSGMGIVSAEEAALGAAMGFLFVQLVFVWAYERVTGRRGMGEGDPKLLLMIGAFLGWKGVLFAVVAGSMQGLVAAAVSYVAGGTLLPPPRPDPLDGWPREDLLGYLKDLFGRRPELLASEQEVMRIEFGLGGEAGTRPESESESEWPRPSPRPAESESESEAEASVGRLMIPFGPFLALGALEFLFFGERLIDAYFGMFE
jgi:leader peptidase (prepilin peptidase)/N-methyltransferase